MECLVDLCGSVLSGGVSGVGLQVWRDLLGFGSGRAIGHLEEAVRVVGQVLVDWVAGGCSVCGWAGAEFWERGL